MSNTGSELVLAFDHKINGYEVTITAHITCSDLTGVSYETSSTFVTP